jgi:protein TonB
MPEFPGGMKGLSKFLKNNFQYPYEAYEKKIHGTVYVQFIIDTDGSVKDPSVINKVNPLLENEALRIIKLFPKWKAGKQNGIPVRVLMSVPIQFKLD